MLTYKGRPDGRDTRKHIASAANSSMAEDIIIIIINYYKTYIAYLIRSEKSAHLAYIADLRMFDIY